MKPEWIERMKARQEKALKRRYYIAEMEASEREVRRSIAKLYELGPTIVTPNNPWWKLW